MRPSADALIGLAASPAPAALRPACTPGKRRVSRRAPSPCRKSHAALRTARLLGLPYLWIVLRATFDPRFRGRLAPYAARPNEAAAPILVAQAPPTAPSFL